MAKAKKYDQTSGPSYSLLALLKRTLFLHETARVDELVEEIHEYMLKDQPYDQIKERYIGPILRSNPSFCELDIENQKVWRLTEGNKVNDSVYEVFQKYRMPLSERQILNRLAKEEHLTDISMTLDLKNDPRFSDLAGGKYWILSEWVVVNEYARSILLKLKGGLPEKELLDRIVEEYKLDPQTAVFLPMLDDRFVKKDKKWTLKRFTEQKTKLRPARIDRLHKYLQTAGHSLTADELTSAVLNLPANTTDVEEKLTADPRFVHVGDRWDLKERLKKQEPPPVEDKTAAAERLLFGPEPEAAPPIAEPAPEEEQPPAFDEGLEAEAAPEPELVNEEADYIRSPDELADMLEEPEEIQVDAEIERLRKKVIDFLQDAFHVENIVYSPEIIDELVTSDERAELFEQFSLEHFANPSKKRELTDSDLIKFMVYLAEPSLNDKILDPCCGTGGFLVQILNTLETNLCDAAWMEKDQTIQYELRNGQFYFAQLSPEEAETLQQPLDDAQVRRLPIERFCHQQQLTGVDAEQYAYKTADLNIAVHGFPEIVLHHDNALASKLLGSGMYDLVIGNPPAVEDYPTRFLRRSLLLAKPGGKIMLLLPHSMFSDYRLVSASLRNQIGAQTIVKAVIDFPEPYNENAYGPRRTLLYCIKKHLDAEQQSSVLLGDIADFDDLRDVIEVLEIPEAPVSQREVPIAGNLLLSILTSYQHSGYNLLIEALRREALEAELVEIQEWMQVKRTEPEETSAPDNV